MTNASQRLDELEKLADEIAEARIARKADSVEEMRKAEHRLSALLVINSETIVRALRLAATPQGGGDELARALEKIARGEVEVPDDELGTVWVPMSGEEAGIIAHTALTRHRESAGDAEARVERVAEAINEARYGGPDDPRAGSPHPLAEESRTSQEYARRLARAAIKAMER